MFRSAGKQTDPARSNSADRTVLREDQPVWAEAPENTIATVYPPQDGPAASKLTPLRTAAGGFLEQRLWGEREIVRREIAAVTSHSMTHTRQHTETNRFLRFFKEIFTRRRGRTQTRYERVPAQAELRHFSQSPETEYVLPEEGRERERGGAAPPTVVYRRPAREQVPSPAPEDSGEEILKQQAVHTSPTAVTQTASSAFPAAQSVGAAASELTREQEEQIAERVLGEINYNRLADELLDRVERRLRAERRKFGR